MKSPSQLIIRDFTKASEIENFRITADGRLVRRGGSRLAYTFSEPVRGVCSVAEDDGEVIYAVYGSTLCRLTESGGVFERTDLGAFPSGAGGSEVTLFRFGGRLYILADGEYFCWDGSTLSAVAGYVPLIRRYSSNTNLGEVWEPMNLLTNRVRMRFCPDGSSKKFKLYGSVASIDAVYFNGSQITSYTPILGAASYVELNVIYATNEDDLLEVWYTLNKTSRRQKITSCPHAAVYGGDTDSRVFLYGGSDAAVIYPSEPTDGLPSGEYFPEDNTITVGDGSLSVTGAVRQFDRLAIFTEDGAFYTYPSESVTLGGVVRYSFPILPLNSDVGATKRGGAALVENEPYALNPNGLYRFKSTSVRDERLAVRVEAPDSMGLDREFIDGCKLYVNRLRGELWCSYGGVSAIYNARLGVWYKFTGIDADILFSWNGEAAYASGNKICLLDESIHTDLGVGFAAVCAGESLDLGCAFRDKTLYRIGVSVERDAGAAMRISLRSDKGGALEYAFTVGEDDGADGLPVVFSARARLGRIGHLRYRLESVSGAAAPLRIRELMLCFR